MTLKKALVLALAAAALVGCAEKQPKDSPPAAASTVTTTKAAETAPEESAIKYEYGVFLGAEPESLPEMMPYKTVVLDAQYFTAEQIAELKDTGHTVYSYINIGALENFRPYYGKYEPLTLGAYENWDEERWVDVSCSEWQSFVLDELAPAILAKGADGFFVDNCDVYYNYPTDEIFDGTAALLKGLKSTGAYVSINGGDEFVTRYAERYGGIDDIMDAVNQETVFSRIDRDGDKFSANPDSEREYFQGCCERVAELGGDVFLLEYTTDRGLIKDIADYCAAHGFTYYASQTLELLMPKDGSGSQTLKN